jgi:hypothetical protein
MVHDWFPPPMEFRPGWSPEFLPLPQVAVYARLASLGRVACFAMGHARIARLLGVLGFLSLVSASLSGCDRHSMLEKTTFLAFSGLIVSYPIVATVIPFEDHTIAFFLNLADGSTRRLVEEKTRYVGVQKIPGYKGHFILVRRKNGSLSFIEYDFQSGTSRILQDTGGITKPFVISDEICGLYPTPRDPQQVAPITQSEQVVFKIFCKSRFVAPDLSIEFYNLIVQSDEEVNIIEDLDDKGVFVHNVREFKREIRASTTRITITSLPHYATPGSVFYYHDNFYVAKGRSPLALLQISGGKVVEYSGELLTRLARAELGHGSRILSVDDTLFVTASTSLADGQINISTWTDNGKIAEWNIDVSSMN